jgi:hypothetical protein
MVDVPSQLFFPIGAVMAASITGAVSFVSLIISKEQKISEFRQSWIDALRNDLSEFSSQARQVAAHIEPFSIKMLASTVSGEAEDRPDPLLANRRRLAQAYYSIRLRLNSSESDHEKLIARLDIVYEVLNTRAESIRFDQTVKELNEMATIAEGVLKREWNRVKAGEPAFATTKAVAKWMAGALAIVLGSTLAYWIWCTLTEP